MRQRRFKALRMVGILMASGLCAAASELTVGDFAFDGPLGSDGAEIERVGVNHFRVTLGHAPEHPDWSNKVQFRILRNAKGNTLRLDIVFLGGDAYRFNEYFYSWSCDGANWQPVHWQEHEKDGKKGDTLVFPVFTEDTVYVGHQVPMSYEDMMTLITRWRESPFVRVHVLGQSLEGRDICRIEITDPESLHSRHVRWVHYFANQHPGEHNAQWRMAGMVDWLLSDAATDCRRRSICHFILMMSPDAPSHGWYRVNGQGVDMNRSYREGGADADGQAHEAYLCQKDLEALMASDEPVTGVWSMHTWGGIVEPIVEPGPEMGSTVGPWTDLRDAIERYDTRDLIKPLKANAGKPTPTYWTDGPHRQFGVTTVLCEGAGALDTKQANVDSGVVLIKGIVAHYRGTK